MPTYLVTAYRWGSTNDHWYLVYAGTDRTKADALAQSEVQDRGGKYDCAVYEFNEDGTEYKLAGYFPAYDQTEPRHNWRIDMFEELGHRVSEYADGYVTMPNPAEPGRLHRVKVDVPECVTQMVARAKERCAMMEALSEKHRAERAAKT